MCLSFAAFLQPPHNITWCGHPLCRVFRYKTKLCKECRRLLTRIERINAEVEVAASTLDEFHVQACVTVRNGSCV